MICIGSNMFLTFLLPGFISIITFATATATRLLLLLLLLFLSSSLLL